MNNFSTSCYRVDSFEATKNKYIGKGKIVDVLPLFLLNIYGAVCMNKVYFNVVLVDAKALLFNVLLWRGKVPLSNCHAVFPRLFCSLPVGNSCRVHSLSII